jgi:hypothetical protein
MTCLRQHFGRRGFANIFDGPLRLAFAVIFTTHYNGLRSFIDTFGINGHDESPPSPSSRGYTDSFDTEVYCTFVNHFGSKGPIRANVVACKTIPHQGATCNYLYCLYI